METRTKLHHASKEYKEAKAQGLIDSEGFLIEPNKDLGNPDISNLDTEGIIKTSPTIIEPTLKEVNQQGTTEEKEPSIPLSQVEEMVNKRIQAAFAEFKPPTESKPSGESRPQQTISYINQEKADIIIPGLENFEFKDRRYVSLISRKAVSDEILSRHKAKSPLQYTHPVSKKVLTLRYASNQSSFFVEEQTGDSLITYIVLKDGFLFVPKENTTLQKFLAIHPHNGTRFKELDQEVEDQLQLDQEELEFKAQKMARELSDIKRDAIARLLCPTFSENWTTATVKKEIYIKAKQNPKKFIGLCEDNTLEMKGVIKTAMHREYISYKNFAFYDADDNLIVAVNRNDDEVETMVSHLSSNRGVSLYEFLKKAVS